MRDRDTQIHTVYFVTRPLSDTPEPEDLVSGGFPRDIMLQFRGGLTADEVLAMYTSREEALTRAKQVCADWLSQ